MRIDQSKLDSVAPTKAATKGERAHRKHEAKADAKVETGDQVHISQASTAATAEAPDTERAARVAQLKAAVADGTYKPDLEQLAQKLADVIGAKGSGHMKRWDLMEDDEILAKTLGVLDELAQVLERERKHIVALDHHAMPVLHLRKVELIEELRVLRDQTAAQGEEVAIYSSGDQATLRVRVKLAAERLMLQARANQFLHQHVVSALQTRAGQEPDDQGTYDGRARRSMRLPLSRKRAA